MVLFLGLAPSFAAQKAQDDNATSKDVKKETMEAIETIKSYSVNQRDKALKEGKDLLDDMDARIDHMQSFVEKKWDKMSQVSREKLNESLTALRKKRNELSEWYGGLKHSSANAWDHVKDGFAEGYESLADAFDKTEKEFGSNK
jgi:uncharacterized protein YicC (UPF0701 family)